MTKRTKKSERETKGRPLLRKVAFVSVCVILLAVHALLMVIGIGGLIERFASDVPWTRFSNPELPRWMLLLQWLLMLGAGVMFIAGFAARWRLLPWAMFAAYVVMGGVCAYQTFFILTNEDRFLDMAIEYLEYTAVLLVLFFMPDMRRRFRLSEGAASR